MSTNLATRPPQRRTRSESRADNRQAIIVAARELVVDVGYANAQLDEIAERAGLTKGAIYSIFGSKIELLRAVVEEHAGQFLPLLGLDVEPDVEHTAEDVLTELARAYSTIVSAPEAPALLALELELFSLALRDPVMLSTVLTHERAFTDRLVIALAGRPRLGGAPLDIAGAQLAADLVLGVLGGLGQRVLTVPWMTWDPEVIATTLIRLLPVAGPA